MCGNADSKFRSESSEDEVPADVDVDMPFQRNQLNGSGQDWLVEVASHLGRTVRVSRKNAALVHEGPFPTVQSRSHHILGHLVIGVSYTLGPTALDSSSSPGPTVPCRQFQGTILCPVLLIYEYRSPFLLTWRSSSRGDQRAHCKPRCYLRGAGRREKQALRSWFS